MDDITGRERSWSPFSSDNSTLGEGNVLAVYGAVTLPPSLGMELRVEHSKAEG